MNIIFSEYGKRYLTQKELVELCAKLDINFLGCRVNEARLEYFEKKNILSPEFRIVKPIWYLKYLFKYRAENKNKIKSKRWHQADLFYERIEEWSNTLKIFHPFDHSTFRSQYLIKPQKIKYTKWKSYSEIVVPDDGNYSHARDIQYYPYWHVYHIFEIIKACTGKHWVNLFDEAINSYKRSNLKAYLLKASVWTLPNETSDKLRERIFSKDKCFDCLSFYVQSVIRSENESIDVYIQKHRTKDYNLEEDYERIKLREKRIAKITTTKYSIILDDQIEFIKYLCEKYFDYEENNMDNFAIMCMYDIHYLSKLINEGYKISMEEIEDKTKRIRFRGHKNPLKYILRGEVAEARESSLRIFQELVGVAFKANKFEITQSEFDKFLNFLDNNGMRIIYLTLKKMYYRPHDFRSPRMMFEHLSSLTIYFESYIKLLLNNTTVAKKDNSCQNKENLRGMLASFFEDEKWSSKVKEAWSDRKYKRVTKENLNALINEIKNVSFDNNIKHDEIIKIFLLVIIFRNYIAHDYFTAYKTLEDDHLFMYIIVGAIWYCWLKVSDKL
jgi:hypothetical protein